MLVDLARNDLGRVCEFNSILLEDLLTVERYSHVMHITSNVTGQLKPGMTAVDALRACLPAGTVSGAPKVRAMESSTSWNHADAVRTQARLVTSTSPATWIPVSHSAPWWWLVMTPICKRVRHRLRQRSDFRVHGNCQQSQGPFQSDPVDRTTRQLAHQKFTWNRPISTRW